jgi:hypothetical protein
LSISDAVIPAKLLRLVCDTAAVRARVQQRSASGSQAGLGISDAVIPAKLLRLVCDTAAVRARVQQRSASGSQAGLSISDAVIPAKLLRLVCDTAAVRAPHACGRKPDSSGRCALPAQSTTPLGLPDASEWRGALFAILNPQSSSVVPHSW